MSGLYAKEMTLKNIFSLGIVAAGLFFCLGCGEGKPPSTEAETKQLYESEDYEQQMMGEMTGSDTTSEGSDTTSE